MISDLLSPQRQRRLSNYIKHLSGLIAYYPLNETDGVTAYNRAPATLGTLNGTTTGATIGQAGKVGKAYSFDGVNDEVNISASPTTVNNNFSALALVKPTMPQATGLIFFNGDDSAGGWGFGVGDTADASGSKLIGLYGGVAWLDSSVTLTDGVWTYIGFVRRSGSLYFYKDGVEIDPSITSTPNTVTNRADIGVQYSGGSRQREAQAIIQHLGVWNRALSATEVLKIARLAGLA